MKCNYCGSDLPKDAIYCGNCGAEVHQVNNNQQYNNEYNKNEEVNTTIVNQNIDDSGSFGWAVLGFFFPPVGLILYFVWKTTKPKSAKMALIGAIVEFAMVGINSIFL